MIKNEIELKALNSFGMGKAYVDENSVSIKVFGVSGCLKAWLTGEKTVEIGNLVGGSLNKQIDTSPFDGILLTQSGRQMFYGKFRQTSPHNLPTGTDPNDENLPKSSAPIDTEKEPILNFNDGFNWVEITTREYPSENLSLRYILSHKCFYNAFMLHGKYYYGTKDNMMAVAIECDIKNEPHPFLNLSAYATYRDGYMIVATDGKNFCYYEY